jgi:hypothetical protein
VLDLFLDLVRIGLWQVHLFNTGITSRPCSIAV